MSKKLVIIPAGGFAREALWLIRDLVKAGEALEPIGFLDDSPEQEGKKLCGLPILGGLEWIKDKAQEIELVVATGFPELKKDLVKRAQTYGVRFAQLIHPRVECSEYVKIGKGSIICAGCILTTQIEIGEFVLINLDCTIGHDVKIGDYSCISPGVHISGRVEIGKGCEIGTGVNIIPGVKIGDDTVVGAGATVINDLPSKVVAVGVPAKVIKERTD